MIYSTPIIVLGLLTSTFAHTKFFCTKTILSAQGRPIDCQGYTSTDSNYVHMWGPKAPNSGQFLTGDSQCVPDQTALENVQKNIRSMCTGRPPQIMAKAKAGGELVFMWPTNNHGIKKIVDDPFAVRFFWDGQSPADPLMGIKYNDRKRKN